MEYLYIHVDIHIHKQFLPWNSFTTCWLKDDCLWAESTRFIKFVMFSYFTLELKQVLLIVLLCLLQVKSVIPFSEPFTVDPQNPPPEKDYNVYFKTLKDGITGKEILEKSPVPVWNECKLLWFLNKQVLWRWLYIYLLCSLWSKS